MTKKIEDYELIPESEVSDKNKTIYAKWREKWKKANQEFLENDPTGAETQLDFHHYYSLAPLVHKWLKKNWLLFWNQKIYLGLSCSM